MTSSALPASSLSLAEGEAANARLESPLADATAPTPHKALSNALRSMVVCMDVSESFSNTEMSATDLFVGRQLGHRRLVADLALLENISPIGDQFREVHVLLRQQNAH